MFFFNKTKCIVFYICPLISQNKLYNGIIFKPFQNYNSNSIKFRRFDVLTHLYVNSDGMKTTSASKYTVIHP